LFGENGCGSLYSGFGQASCIPGKITLEVLSEWKFDLCHVTTKHSFFVYHIFFSCTSSTAYSKTYNLYSLRPKKQVILGFKICPKKQVILPYLESACACKNQLVPNMGNK
jgi:hypothetical protein